MIIFLIVAILLILVYILYRLFILKRIKRNKKSIVVQIGPSLNDKGGMVTVMNQLIDSGLKEKYNILHIPTYLVGNKIMMFMKAIIKFILVYFKYNIEFVHIHTASKGSFYRKSIFIRICYILRIKVVLHTHGAGFKDFFNNSNMIIKKYISSTIRKSYKLIVLSEIWKEFYSSFISENRIEVIYNTMDIPKDIIRTKNEDCIIGLALGRLGHRKGTYDIINAVENIKDKNLNFKIILAGDGEIEEARNMIKNKGIEEYFEVVGWIGKEDKEEYLKKSSFLLLPSYNEGLPMAILEAMSRKLLVISSYVGGIPEVITTEENGLLINAGDVEILSKYIERAVIDETNNDMLAENGYNTVKEKFNQEKMIEKLDELYENIICKNIKLFLASSAGGHFMQLKQLFKISEKYNTVIITEKNAISLDLKDKHNMRFLTQQERKKIDFIFKYGFNILKSMYFIFVESPDIIISTGAGATYPLCLITKIYGGKVIFIESFAKIKSPTITGTKAYKFADEFYVQWPEMKEYYPNAKYEGGIY